MTFSWLAVFPRSRTPRMCKMSGAPQVAPIVVPLLQLQKTAFSFSAITVTSLRSAHKWPVTIRVGPGSIMLAGTAIKLTDTYARAVFIRQYVIFMHLKTSLTFSSL